MNHSHDSATAPVPVPEDVPATLADVGVVEGRLENVESHLREVEHRLAYVERRLRTLDRALCQLWGNTYGAPVLPEPD